MNAAIFTMALCQLIILILLIRLTIINSKLREELSQVEDIKDVVQDVIEHKPLVPEPGDTKREARKKSRLNRKSQKVREKILRSNL